MTVGELMRVLEEVPGEAQIYTKDNGSITNVHVIFGYLSIEDSCESCDASKWQPEPEASVMSVLLA